MLYSWPFWYRQVSQRLPWSQVCHHIQYAFSSENVGCHYESHSSCLSSQKMCNGEKWYLQYKTGSFCNNAVIYRPDINIWSNSQAQLKDNWRIGEIQPRIWFWSQAVKQSHLMWLLIITQTQTLQCTPSGRQLRTAGGLWNQFVWFVNVC